MSDIEIIYISTLCFVKCIANFFTIVKNKFRYLMLFYEFILQHPL